MLNAAKSIPKEKIVELDVRPILLAGDEPITSILESVNKVPEGGALRLRATFEPVPLFHLLGQDGWEHEVEASADMDWTILFFKKAANKKSHKTS